MSQRLNAGSITLLHNVEAIRGDGAIIGRHCEGCGAQHDPDKLFDGGRYLSLLNGGRRWLCVDCYIGK